MRRAVYCYGRGEADEPSWAIAGLLHDADYERWLEEHQQRVVAWLRDRGEEAIAHAVAAHVARAGAPCETGLDRALLACDELTGFVADCAVVRPDDVRTLNPSSVKKKLMDRSFAAKVDRDEIRASAEQFGLSLYEHLQLVVDVLSPCAEALGLGGDRRP